MMVSETPLYNLTKTCIRCKSDFLSSSIDVITFFSHVLSLRGTGCKVLYSRYEINSDYPLVPDSFGYEYLMSKKL